MKVGGTSLNVGLAVPVDKQKGPGMTWETMPPLTGLEMVWVLDSTNMSHLRSLGSRPSRWRRMTASVAADDFLCTEIIVQRS